MSTTAREARFPLRDAEETFSEFEDSPVTGIEDDLEFGGFWYVNFKNLESKNMDLLEGLGDNRRRAKSF